MNIGNVSFKSDFMVNSRSKTNNNLSSSKSSTFADKLNKASANQYENCADKILDEINNEADPIDREEDLIFFNSMKDCLVKMDKDSDMDLNKLKESVITFPPNTAPGYVRKAFREALEKIPESRRGDIKIKLALQYNSFLEYGPEGTEKSPSNILTYKNFAEYISQFLDFDVNALGAGNFQYVMSLLDNFQSNLQKEEK